jgi:putative phosphonate metabolism protein
MTLYKRVAIFYAPGSQTPLANFGAQWLGWDVEHAKSVPHPDIDGLPAPISDLVATPQKYGFHGTLKAPFRLHENQTLDNLRDAMKAFSEQHRKFFIGQMKVAKLGSFVAIIQENPSDEFANFASNIVTHFEDYRAPLTDEDIAKRRKAKLTPRQDELMLKWGYPFIFDQFKFHLTLTGKLSEQNAKSVCDRLTDHLKPILDTPVEAIDLCLYGEREDGRFEIIERFPFLG